MELSSTWNIHIRVDDEVFIAHMHKGLALNRHKLFLITWYQVSIATNTAPELLAERLGKSPEMHHFQTKKETQLI